MTQGNFVWHELYVRDVEAAKAFYAATAGWTYEPMPIPQHNRTMWLAKADGKPVAGIMDMHGIVPDGDPPHWLAFIEVENVDRCVAEMKTRGCRIAREPFDIPNGGRIAIGADPTGAFLGLMTSKR